MPFVVWFPALLILTGVATIKLAIFLARFSDRVGIRESQKIRQVYEDEWWRQEVEEEPDE